ncbi:MAG: carboxypeptidase-like regulatory domain-containing protein [Flavipsychrobacter sp.]
MARTLRYLLVLLFTAISGTAFAQGQSGEIGGKIVDDKGEPAISATVQALEGGIVKGGTVTDYDGNYVIKPLSPGRYQIKITYIGMKTEIVENVIVSSNKLTTLNKKLAANSSKLEEVVVTTFKVPLIDIDQPGGKKVITGEEIDKMPTRNTTSVASTAPGVYQAADGGGLSIGGARGSGTLYYVDGVQVVGGRGINMSQGVIDQVQVLTSGVPAKYGDALGGIINITTRGISRKTRGSVLLERSVDGYGHNLVNFNLSGPLVSKKVDTMGTKKPVVGFLLGGDFWYDEDDRPLYTGTYVAKDDVLEGLKQTPLVVVPNPNGNPVFRNASEFVRKEDLQLEKKRANAERLEGRINAKLDFQLAENLNLTAGGSFNYERSKGWIRSAAIFAPEANPITNSYTGRGYLRLTQRFGKQNYGAPKKDEDGNPIKPPIITNAYYTIQADYQKDYVSSEHPDHGRDIFKYGYVGKFNTTYFPIYGTAVDSVSGLPGQVLLVDRFAAATTYERSELNPVLANYTSQYFNSIGGISPGNIQGVRGLATIPVNGELPQSTYGINTNVGASVGSYSYSELDQFAVSVDASFDLQLPNKPRHSIEFGMYYQQRASRGYSVGMSASGNSLWQYMRQLSNNHISLDQSNPIFRVNGQNYSYNDLLTQGISPSPFDTILYNRIANGETQSTFATNIRKKLGLKNTDYVDVDELDPSTFSIDMFSADEILNSGNAYVGYQGYTYTGEKQKGQVNFNDFFTKKDANGNFTRDIGAFRPNYIAGYILDRFQFKDIRFNLGVRIERFDANTKVLKDPYSLYAVNTLSDARNITDPTTGERIAKNNFNGGTDPGNIGSDYVVYVNNNESSSPSIIGYRNGDDWYDPYGNYIEDPAVLKEFSGGRDPQPYLVDRSVRIQDSNFNPNNSFTDYKPQVNVMPRIAFQFPISDVALFYAHYDVLVQRPSNVFETPNTYYNLTTNTQNIINNPGLKPQKMFDYEVGFTQQLTPKSAITLSGFYKERKDMIQVRPYLYAWPTTYYTYGNRDFSTTKGLTLRYDLRRVGNLRMDVAYTLQFADGTGSGTATANGGSGSTISSNGLLQQFNAASKPNLRFTMPLSVDSRHMIVTTVDYRFAKGKGPVVANQNILQNAGLNLIFRARSGEPYTRYIEAASNTVAGSIQGSRLPWHYMLDLRADKDFNLSVLFKKKDDSKGPRRVLNMNAYVLVQNLLNTRDVFGVNGYTNRPDDNGYLASPIGIQQTNNQIDPLSFVDLYTINQINPFAINLPRRINIGLNFSFN